MTAAGLENSPVSLKVVYLNEFRRLTYSENEPTFAGLCALLGEIFGLDSSSIVLKYLDNDGDKITMSTDGELKEAIKSAKEVQPLRLFIDVKPTAPAEEEKGKKHVDLRGPFMAMPHKLRAYQLPKAPIKVVAFKSRDTNANENPQPSPAPTPAASPSTTPALTPSTTPPLSTSAPVTPICTPTPTPAPDLSTASPHQLPSEGVSPIGNLLKLENVATTGNSSAGTTPLVEQAKKEGDGKDVKEEKEGDGRKDDKDGKEKKELHEVLKDQVIAMRQQIQVLKDSVATAEDKKAVREKIVKMNAECNEVRIQMVAETQKFKEARLKAKEDRIALQAARKAEQERTKKEAMEKKALQKERHIAKQNAKNTTAVSNPGVADVATAIC